MPDTLLPRLSHRCLILVSTVLSLAWANGAPEHKPDGIFMPASAKLVFEEDWSSGKINPDRWYRLQKKWGKGNHGTVHSNVFFGQDIVDGKKQHVLVCRGHGDQYKGPVVGLHGQTKRVGGVIVSKPFFASGRFEVVMKIGNTQATPNRPKDPTRPIGMIPAIWTYGYRWVPGDKSAPQSFSKDNPMYNPHLNYRGWNSNEYWSEIDFPEFGKNQDLETGLYNGFVNNKHQSLTFPTKVAIDGQYHRFTTIWRTRLENPSGADRRYQGRAGNSIPRVLVDSGQKSPL